MTILICVMPGALGVQYGFDKIVHNVVGGATSTGNSGKIVIEDDVIGGANKVCCGIVDQGHIGGMLG